MSAAVAAWPSLKGTTLSSTQPDQGGAPASSDAYGQGGPAALVPCGGTSLAPSGDDSGRNEAGRFVKGNRASLQHGLNSKRTAEELAPELVAAIAEKRAAIMADLGGEDGISVTRQQLVAEFLRVSVIADSLGDDLLRRGVLTGKGKTRAAATLYLRVLDRVHRLASVIGLERQQRHVSPLDYVNGQGSL